MINSQSNKTIEQQLAEIDPNVIAKGHYLYLYIRPAVRATYWHLMVRNVYRPYTLDNELARPLTQQTAELAVQNAALVLGCSYNIINQFSLDSRSHQYKSFPYREDLKHPIEVIVVHEPQGYKVVIYNERLKLTYPVGNSRPNIIDANNDARIIKNFYEKPVAAHKNNSMAAVS